MKLILNNCNVEINSSTKENRNKVVKNAAIVPSLNKWKIDGENYQGYFVNLYIGDVVLVTNGTSNDIRAAFVASNEVVNDESVSFADGTSRVFDRADLFARHGSVAEDCYLYVLTKYNGVDYNYAVTINGKTLDDNGYL